MSSQVIIRKIPLSPSKVDQTSVLNTLTPAGEALTGWSEANIFEKDTSGNYLYLEDEGIADDSGDGADIGGSFDINTYGNVIRNMFDGDNTTFLSFKGNYENTIAPNGSKFGQLIFNFGRKIKPRKIILDFHMGQENILIGNNVVNLEDDIESNGSSHVMVYFTNDLDDINAHVNVTGDFSNTSNMDSGGDGEFVDTVDMATYLTLGQGVEGIGNAYVGQDFVVDTFEGTAAINRRFTLDQSFFTNGTADNNQFLVFQFLEPQTNFVKISEITIYEEVDIREYSVEFDDALLDLQGWINPRYKGSKLIAKELNKFTPKIMSNEAGIGFSAIEGLESPFEVDNFDITAWPGDINGPGTTPTISNRTTAIYYTNTVVGGTEDPQFATLQNHSYVGIQKILNINKINQSITIIDKDTEGVNVGRDLENNYEGFHRQVTTDFPTGGKLNLRLVDNSINSALQNEYFVKMNKGWLLKSFTFNYIPGSDEMTRNTLYLYSGSRLTRDLYKYDPAQDMTVEMAVEAEDEEYPVGTFFRYANNWSIPYAPYPAIVAGITLEGPEGGQFDINQSGPSFVSSSIHQNEFTSRYYSGSFGVIKEPPLTIPPNTVPINTQNYADSSLGSASKFIAIDSLDYLRENETETEFHITFLQGTKDFAPGKNDERSIGTFEIDKTQQYLELGSTEVNAGLPRRHELRLKGGEDTRFKPLLRPMIPGGGNEDTPDEDFLNAHVELTDAGGLPGIAPTGNVWASIDKNRNASVFIQGGVNGFRGLNSIADNTGFASENKTTIDNSYSGSLNYELSWLRKDHAIIISLNKDAELMDGIGEQGAFLIPEHLDLEIRDNLDYYIQQASTLLGFGGLSDDAITYIPKDKQ